MNLVNSLARLKYFLLSVRARTLSRVDQAGLQFPMVLALCWVWRQAGQGQAIEHTGMSERQDKVQARIRLDSNAFQLTQGWQ